MNTRASILIAAILCVIGSALCQNPPAAPKLPQQFTTNYTIVFPEYPSTVSIGGFFALDVPHGGAFADMGGEEFIPVSFHTNLVASPDIEGIITSFMYEGPLCWNMSTVPLSVFTDIPFQIPEYATFLGNGDISGQSVTGWFFELNIWGSPIYVTMWVSTSNNIVQIQIDNLMYFKCN